MKYERARDGQKGDRYFSSGDRTIMKRKVQEQTDQLYGRPNYKKGGVVKPAMKKQNTSVIKSKKK